MSRLYTDVLREDPLAVPTGIEEIMRDAEVHARELYEEATELSRAVTPLSVLNEAIEDLHRFLENPRESMLHRMLRRPRAQRRMDSPAGRGFSQYVSGLIGRAKRALETQQRVIAVQHEVDRLAAKYGTQLPHFFADRMRRSRADEEALLNSRRPEDVDLIARRLAAIDVKLDKLMREMPAEAESARGKGAVRTDPTQPTTTELHALARSRLRQRAAIRKEENLDTVVRAQLGAHFDRLQALNTTADDAIPVRHLGEQFVADARNPRGYFERRHDDLWLWPGMIGNAAEALLSTLASAEHQISLPTPPVRERTERRERSGISYVVPLGDDLALISESEISAVQVWSRGIDVGRKVDARVVGNDDGLVDPIQAPRDIGLLFDGYARGVSGWYDNTIPVRLHVISRLESACFARIERRGRIEYLKNVTASSEPPSPRSFRTLASPLAARSTTQSVSRVDLATGHEYLRYKTHVVATGIDGFPIAWLRESPPHLAAGKAANDGERRFMNAVWAAAAPAQALSYLGRGILPNGHDGPLYELPLGLRVADSPLLRDWIETPEGKLDCLRAVARVIVTSHRVGWSMGDVRLGAFLFGLHWAFGDPQPRLAPIVANAPFAAKLGEPYTHAGSAETLASQKYERLGVHGVLKPLSRAGPAIPSVDYRSFGMLALDLLAREPFEQGKRWSDWESLPMAVAESGASHFDFPALAVRISRCLGNQAAAEQLSGLIESLAESGVTERP